MSARCGAAPLAAALLLALAAPVRAEIYRWTDDRGTVHFSQSLDDVPPQHREAARTGAAKPSPDRLQTFAPPTPHSAALRRSRGTITIPFERHGTLMKVDARLNDRVSAPFYIDTGASGVAIPAAVAERLGIRVGPSTPTILVHTANGVARHPIVELDAVELGGARVENLRATVNPTMRIGLLGGAFFNNFIYRVDAAQGVIALVPNDAMRAGLDEASWRERFQVARGRLAHLESYLEGREITRPGRRAELQRNLVELRRAVEELEREANRAGVPTAWRH